MRVGLIRTAKKHPDADSLYVEEVKTYTNDFKKKNDPKNKYFFYFDRLTLAKTSPEPLFPA